MNTTNHTPGTWNHVYGAIMANGQIICEIPNPHWPNARLIAAAPDLLEALRFLLADYTAINGEKLTGSSVPIEMARAAILKAEGLK